MAANQTISLSQVRDSITGIGLTARTHVWVQHKLNNIIIVGSYVCTYMHKNTFTILDNIMLLYTYNGIEARPGQGITIIL